MPFGEGGFLCGRVGFGCRGRGCRDAGRSLIGVALEEEVYEENKLLTSELRERVFGKPRGFLIGIVFVAMILASSCGSAYESRTATIPDASSNGRETSFCEIIYAPEKYAEAEDVRIANASLVMVAGLGLTVDSEPSCTIRYSLIDVDLPDSFVDDTCSWGNEELCVVSQHVANGNQSAKGSAWIIRGTLVGRIQAYYAPEAMVSTKDHIRFRFKVLRFATVDGWSTPNE